MRGILSCPAVDGRYRLRTHPHEASIMALIRGYLGRDTKINTDGNSPIR
jgi:hypothetical protein